MRCSELLPPFSPRFVVLRLAIPYRAPVFVPFKPDADLGPGVLGLVNPGPDLTTWRRQELPGSWGTLVYLCPALRPRLDQRIRPYDASARPPRWARRRLHASGNFGAQSHGFGTGCLRFARWVTPQDARLASGCLPSSPGRDWLPAGFLRKVSGCCYIVSPFPKLSWRKPTPCSNRGLRQGKDLRHMTAGGGPICTVSALWPTPQRTSIFLHYRYCKLIFSCSSSRIEPVAWSFEFAGSEE